MDDGLRVEVVGGLGCWSVSVHDRLQARRGRALRVTGVLACLRSISRGQLCSGVARRPYRSRAEPMLSARRNQTNAAPALAAAAVAVIIALALWLQSPSAGAVGLGQLQQRIGAGRSRIADLAGAVRADSGTIARLDAGIAALQRRLSRIQADLGVKLTQLARLRLQLASARNRLAQLEAFEARGERVLARQLVSSYETDQPDLITVILESTGFQDLLERLQFAARIQREDVQIVTRVRAARRAVAAEAVRLGALEVRQQRLTAQIIGERNRLARTQVALLRQRVTVTRARAAKASRLTSVRAEVAGWERQVAQIEAAQAARTAEQAPPGQPAGSSPSAAGSFGAPSVSSSGFVFPLPKSAASPPGTWSPDQGVDISAPGDTPEYAVCSGTIVLHGIGGFGPWAPVLHCDSPIDGYSYVYYGHAGPEYQLPIGTHVGAGQVMSSVGPGIVGISTGPHLEIGFADSSGSPIGPQTAGTMLALLQSAY
jgi:murein DD-endopeptidase MepM/ murein hydrolase activator NlpD